MQKKATIGGAFFVGVEVVLSRQEYVDGRTEHRARPVALG